MIVIADYILIILIGAAIIIGIGIGFFLRKINSPYANKRYFSTKNKHFLTKIYRKIYKFKRYNWAIIGFFWFILLVIFSSYHETNFIINSIINLISLIIGLNISHKIMKIIMRKPARTQYDIWAIRIKAIIFACFGIFIAIFASLSTYTVDTSGVLPMVEPSILTIYFWSIGLGMIIFAAYMEFVFERTAGILVFGGRQRF